jgi:hypothetical protein
VASGPSKTHDGRPLTAGAQRAGRLKPFIDMVRALTDVQSDRLADSPRGPCVGHE